MKVSVKVKVATQPLGITTEYIKLESALKLANLLPSGGTAKLEIQEGQVQVNGEPCTMRGKKLRPGDSFSYGGQTYEIVDDGTA